jgi:sugar-specific transcriptional regulator TrmB
MGLTNTETSIYLAGLSKRASTLQELCKRTKIKRPTAYHALHTLMEKGLVAEEKESNRSYFTMSEPASLRGLIERQRDAVEDRMKALNVLLPILLQKQGQAKDDDVSVVQHHGIEGMKTVMDIALYCKSRKWDIIAPYQNFLREYDPAYAQKYLRSRKLHRIVSRTLWENRSGWKKLSPEDLKLRNPRYMPASMKGTFKAMIILFDDKIAMFSSYETLTAVLITSREIHDMLEAMFEVMWEVSRPYEIAPAV